ncbi:MAG: amidohydrolase family protein, partial [Spirochaetales bacterium]|nr:amidohydrolase family protein [Spirochaetales bacterium]
DVETFLLKYIPVSWKQDNRYYFKFDDMTIRKVILTPLMMDFDGRGYKGDEQLHFNLPPYKPIVEQVVDVFNGIKRYNKITRFQLFEIYPFVGINPQNYDCIDDDIIPIPREFQSLKKDEIFDEMKQCFIPAEQESCIAILINKTGIYAKAQYPVEDQNKEDEYIIIAVEEISQSEKDTLSKAIDPDYKKNTHVKHIIEKLLMESDNNSLQKLLYKYFGDYDARKDLHEEFRKKYKHNFIEGNYNGDIHRIRSYFFAGIKLYPALGFDPWPDESDNIRDIIRAKTGDNPGQDDIEYGKDREKVEFIYRFCAAKKIPLTVHCQDTSFGTIDKKNEDRFTDPGRWEEVLEKYPDLKINFAHLGLLEKEKKYPPNKWVRKIIEYMTRKKDDNPAVFRYPNIYADFACKGRKEGNYDFYRYFASMLKNYRDKQNIDIIDRILFGSDFPLQLFFHTSYEHYLSLFMSSGYFTQKEKTLFFNHNPARFLFNTHKNDKEF